MGQPIAASELDSSIKWSRAVKRDLSKGVKYEYNDVDIVETMYRPFVKRHLYFNRSLNEVQYQLPSMFKGNPNPTIAFLSVSSSNPLAAMAVDRVFDRSEEHTSELQVTNAHLV